MNYLSARERKIIEQRLFLSKTFEAIGQEFGVTRERIRQIEFTAIDKMREPAVFYDTLKPMLKTQGILYIESSQ